MCHEGRNISSLWNLANWRSWITKNGLNTLFYINTKEKTQMKLRFGLLDIKAGTWMSVHFFIPKKILGGKHQSKKFRLQICNLVNINKKVWSLLIGKSMCMVIIPCMKKYLTGPLFTYIHQYWSAAMWEKMFCFDEKIVFWSKIL